MIQTWQLQEAKNKFSRVVHNAVASGPQIITKYGVEVAIVLSYAEYQRMIASRGSLSTFFRNSPLAGTDLMDLVEGSHRAFEASWDATDVVMHVGRAVDAHRDVNKGALADRENLFPVLNATLRLTSVVGNVDHGNLTYLGKRSRHYLHKVFAKMRLAP